VLVANRGEIARRVFATCRKMGIETVAVFSEGDRHAPFVRDADVAYDLGGTTAADSYLNVEKILAAAAATEADAIHPGYGFLAENAAFAEAVNAAGLTWIGPSPEAISVMGDKIRAKETMAAAGVPMLPSATIDGDASAETLAAIAANVGFPLLVKASAGGGGRGMRLVESANDLADAVAGAQREAANAFGDGTVYLERYLAAAHHIEIQVLGDTHGNVVHLWERECSIQRRHQKIIEEAPSPNVTPELRQAMADAALAGARSIGYFSTGTVELLMPAGSTGEFYFLEMNTRLQVEHPVTEEITGIDLVRQQIRVAQGLPLDMAQADIQANGHAIEVRVYAEDVEAGFLPATGTVTAFGLRADRGDGVRIDSGVEAGSVVGLDFDPMLAKITTHAPTREEATAHMALALRDFTLTGLTTNQGFLINCLQEPAFAAGDTTTAFIDTYAPGPQLARSPRQEARLLTALVLCRQARNRAASPVLGFMRPNFRNAVLPPQELLVEVGGAPRTVRYEFDRYGEVTAVVDAVVVDDASADESNRDDNRVFGECRGRLVTCHPPVGSDGTVEMQATIDGITETFSVVVTGQQWNVQGARGSIAAIERSPFPDPDAATIVGGQLAPMPGVVRAVNVAVGDQVAEGDTLVVIEAMKMEHTVTANAAASVTEVRCSVGEQVDNGAVLVVLEDPT